MNFVNVTEQELRAIGTVFAAETGRELLGYKKDFLARCIYGRVQRLRLAGGSAGYRAYIEMNPAEAMELREALSVYHTRFNRDPEKWRIVKDVILKDVLDRKRAEAFPRPGSRKTLRVWSAGCAGGEEPYTIAMMILEALGGERGQWDIAVQATDIHVGLIEKGREGVYGLEELRKTEIDARSRERYFEPAERGFLRVADFVRGLVSFSILDLTENGFLPGMDIVFCRNVLIYFRPEVVRGITQGFHRSLNSSGYLVLGNSETLENRFLPLYRTMKQQGEYYYRKIDPGSAEHEEALARQREIRAGLGIEP